MLVLSRKAGEQILIGNDVRLTVVAVKGNRVTIGIDAPKSVKIERSEIAKVSSQQGVPAPALVEQPGSDSLAASVAG